MFVAVDKDKNKIHINYITHGEQYFCPVCDSEVIVKKGEVRAHHFSHRSKGVCKDLWHYDMTEWHFIWQNKFPLECQEVVKEFNGEKHRADVLIEKTKIVLEFQHSSLSSEEFEARNTFYNNLGYKVIWIFDAEEQFINDKINNYKSNLWRWERPRKTLEFFSCRNKLVEIYLQIDNKDPCLIKAVWCTDDKGFSRFATDGYDYCERDFVRMCENKEKEGNVVEKAKEEVNYKLYELFDSLIELYSKDHTTYYFGCPVSNTHICANCNIDVPKSKYSEIMPCMDCEYKPKFNYYEDNEYICKKRFMDINLPLDLMVRIEGRDSYNFINKISYDNNGERVYKSIPAIQPTMANNIYSLWEENNCKVAIFKNLITGKFAKIKYDPKLSYKKYREVKGYLSLNQYKFNDGEKDIYYADKKQWICVWHISKDKI